MRFAGNVSKPAQVTVGGNTAVVKADGTYEGWAQIAPNGTTRVHIVATDHSGNIIDKYTDVTSALVALQNISYDLNGNQTIVDANGMQTTYGWDAANRLVSINQAVDNSQFERVY